jgi:uncharacterized membrane protein YoaT (DUF817 family)
LELLTRGFASLPFDSFAFSLVIYIKDIIEQFDVEVKHYSGGQTFPESCMKIIENFWTKYCLLIWPGVDPANAMGLGM